MAVSPTVHSIDSLASLHLRMFHASNDAASALAAEGSDARVGLICSDNDIYALLTLNLRSAHAFVYLQHTDMASKLDFQSP
jgi:hypothetical protein